MLLTKLLLSFAIGIPCLAFSQSKDTVAATADTTIIPKKNEFHFQVSYQTRLHYYGRTDSLKSSGYTANIGYELKNGLFAGATGIFITTDGSPATYTGTALEAGYNFPQKKHFTGSISYTHFLYQDKSVLIQSAVKNQAGVSIAIPNKIITLSLGGDIRFSNKTDYGSTAGLDHLFIIKTKVNGLALALDPTVVAYAGTQSFTSTYYEKQNYLGIPFGSKEVTSSERRFNILAYEASVPVVLVYKKLNFSATPAYIIPQNIVAIPNRPDLSERGNPFYYVTLSAGIRL